MPRDSSGTANSIRVAGEMLRNGYVTDSMHPILFKVPVTADGVGKAEPWLSFEGTPLQYEEGFN
ncbi:MAG TPA: hypothetical protein VK359_09845, partial [Rubrobacteraceae bacterium]|nr:hypothetical protein [Rubrobacteraceae bacterium]